MGLPEGSPGSNRDLRLGFSLFISMGRNSFSIHRQAAFHATMGAMKKRIVTKQWRWIVSTVAALALTGTAGLAQSQPNRLRVGVYDSRAVAVAYYSSSEFRDTMEPVKADYEKAKAEKKENRVKTIDA